MKRSGTRYSIPHGCRSGKVSPPTFSELMYVRCEVTLEQLLKLPPDDRFYRLIQFQRELIRRDAALENLIQEAWTKPPGAQRIRVLRDLSDCRVVIHSFMNKAEKQLQYFKSELRVA